MMNFDKLAELRMRQAAKNGELDGLPGEGKPLHHKSAATVEAFGYGSMASSGVLPEEIELKKAIEQQKTVIAGLSEGAARKDAMKKLAELQMRLSMQEEARRKYFSD